MSTDNSNKDICCQCGTALPQKSFYKTYSDFYSGISHLPICKDCFTRKYHEYCILYGSHKMAMQRMCMSFDIYFSETLFDKYDDGTDAVIGNYIKELNMKQNKGRTFEDTIKSGNIFADLQNDSPISRRTRVNDIHYEDDDNSGDIRKKDITRWGEGFDYEDYKMLNAHYEYLTQSNPEYDNNQIIFITDLCYQKMQQMKSLREGRIDDYNKLTEQYRKTFDKAGLNVARESDSKEDVLIGVSAEIIEQYTPAEYYLNKKLYKDFDNIGEYIKRFILRPLKNLMTGTKERDAEFCVQEGDDDADEE